MAEADATQDIPDPSKAPLLDAYLKFAVPDGPPDSLGPWRILEVLGEGGMGIVYLAEQTEPVRRRVALKLIKLGMDTRDVLARFNRERQTLALMDHPNIARVLDAGAVEDGRPYFVMELVKGLPLTEYCDRHKLNLKDRLLLFEQVCHAVQHAHHKGIIHRDLKPSNILVSSANESAVAKIIDFGVARAVQHTALERSLYTELGQMIGTPAYMSPEQADMTSEDIDSRSDIYSLGVVLYELLVGVAPFDIAELRRGGFEEMRRIIREVEPPSPSTRFSRLRDGSASIAERRKSTINYLTREIRGDLDWITLKALEKDRTRRYSTASELAADLRRYLQMEPVLARRPGALYRFRKLVRRRRGAFMGSGVALLIMACTAVFMKVSWERSRRDECARRSRSLRLEGETAWSDHIRLSTRADEARRQLESQIAGLPGWAPIWERAAEIEITEELERLHGQAEEARSRAELSLTAAITTAWRGSPEELEARRALENLFFQAYELAEPGPGSIDARSYFRNRAQSIGLGTYQQSFEGRGRISIASDPPGAAVHCFRFVAMEGRLVPVPFDARAGRDVPSRGLLPAPVLRVDRVWDSTLPFAPGDRLARVGGRSISSFGDLAGALAGVAPDASLRIVLDRSGERIEADWVPFPMSLYGPAGPLKGPYAPGRLLDFHQQLGLGFEAYPLEFPERAVLGRTEPGRRLDVELPAGSYLIVLRHEVYLDMRLPVSVPDAVVTETVKLLRPSEVPRGFVPIPAGPVACGGDPEAFQSLERRVQTLPAFLASRFELTTGEYLEFINDPEIAQRIDDEGYATPSVQAAIEDLERAGVPDHRIQLVPRYVNRPSGRERFTMWNRVDGAWRLEGAWKSSGPILGIPQLAALEYAAWRTRKEGGTWRYRLPTDVEWEKVARGVDRRLHVWGNSLVWSFCWSSPGVVGDGQPRPPQETGIYPFDESVFGVRDLAGSVAEYTTSRPLEGYRLTTVRGGHWLSLDRQDFRAASRSTLDPIHSRNSSGIRLVAERIGH